MRIFVCLMHNMPLTVDQLKPYVRVRKVLRFWDVSSLLRQYGCPFDRCDGRRVPGSCDAAFALPLSLATRACLDGRPRGHQDAGPRDAVYDERAERVLRDVHRLGQEKFDHGPQEGVGGRTREHGIGGIKG